MQDSELMARVKAGDQTAFRDIVHRYQDVVIRVCFRYVSNQTDAEELAQEVFIRLYQSAPSYEVKGKLTTYLYRIAVNLSLNFIRDQKRRRLFSLETWKDKIGFPHPADDAVRPDVQLEREETERLIREAIDSLPGNQRTAVILKRYEELSYEEIAQVMGCSVSSVETRLFRARQTLRKKLKRLTE